MLKRTLPIVLGAAFLTACNPQQSTPAKSLTDKQIAKLIPARVSDRASWAGDIAQVFDQLKLPKTTQNICTAIAVIDQESNFHADP